MAGPYTPAVLRFQIRFPPSYPDLPPLVTFSTDIFHPLLVPLTTYTFTTGSSDTDTVSATDEERLPPGGFSLRHGFPQWFGRAKRAAGQASSRNVSGGTPTDSGSVSPSSTSQTFDSASARTSTPVPPITPQRTLVSKILEYIRSTFDDATVLDTVPLEAAGNPSAWHAWRAHRKIAPRGAEPGSDTEGKSMTVAPVVPEGLASPKKRASAMAAGATVVRQPGDWNWEGVWTKRARAAIEASNSEPVLFGGNYRGADDALVCLNHCLELLETLR